jgi:hypothetical protein
MAKIGEIKCTACDGVAHVSEGKGGTLSIACKAEGCKAQTMVKSPNAVAKLRARLAGSAAPESSSSPAAPGASLADFLKT